MSVSIGSTIVLQGTKEAIHEFIKLGLKNSELEPSDDIFKDFKLLLKEGKTKIGVDDYCFEGDSTKAVDIKIVEKLSAYTFDPMPDTFHMYDTSDHPDAFPEAVKEQKKKYGIVGWYDYNCKFLGTRYNFEIAKPELSYDDKDKRCILRFYTNALHVAWCQRIKTKFPEIGVFIRADADQGLMYDCGEITIGGFERWRDTDVPYFDSWQDGDECSEEFGSWEDEWKESFKADFDWEKYKKENKRIELDDDDFEDVANEAFYEYLDNDFQAMLDSAWGWIHET